MNQPTHPPGTCPSYPLKIGDGGHQFLIVIHHEGPVGSQRLLDGRAGQHQHQAVFGRGQLHVGLVPAQYHQLLGVGRAVAFHQHRAAHYVEAHVIGRG